MIRQPRRSTAAIEANHHLFTIVDAKVMRNVTTPQRNISTRPKNKRKPKNCNNNIALFVIVLLCAVAQQCAAWPSEYGVAVGRSAHAPKFGERLLPLRKQKSANLKFGANINFTTTSTNASAVLVATSTTATSVNSLNLNKNNYIVSNSQQPKQEKSNNADNNNNHNNIFDAELVTIVPLPAYSDSYLPKPRRQGKQLHRRQDINIAEVLELSDATLQQQQLRSAPNASISKADRLVVEMSTEFFVVPTSSSSTTSTTSTVAGKTRSFSKSSRGISSLGAGPRSVLIVASKTNVNTSSSAPTIISTHGPFGGGGGGLRREPWVVPVLVLASLTMLMMGAFEIFVLFKAWRTSPSRRHLFLGQMLLLGLFACAGLGAIITAQPTLLSCGTLRFGIGVAYALVFAALLVKCVFLISLNGGVYLPAPYQGLLLLFAVLIQVAIGAQWLLTTPPEIYTLSVPILSSDVFGTSAAATSNSLTSSTAAALARVFQSSQATPQQATSINAISSGSMLIPLCKTQFSELLLSLIYIVFLIVFVSVLAIKSRGIRDNYREATYIGLAIGGAIPIWLGWMLCGLAVAERHKDACIAFGLVATSATVFLVMFMPKGRQLAAMGKEGLYVEDREEQFSSLSRAGSGYSPSFFHFKPIKYGVMGGMQNSATNTGNATSMKHCSNGISGGDRIALVTAAPPSYTRMYHYFPAHLSHPFCFYPQPPPPAPPPMTQLPPLPPTLKQLGNSIASMTQAHIAQTLRYPGLFIRPDETNLYTTLEPTLSSNPNVYFQRGGAVHPGMMY